jgi:hypothetical protein
LQDDLSPLRRPAAFWRRQATAMLTGFVNDIGPVLKNGGKPLKNLAQTVR